MKLTLLVKLCESYRIVLVYLMLLLFIILNTYITLIITYISEIFHSWILQDCEHYACVINCINDCYLCLRGSNSKRVPFIMADYNSIIIIEDDISCLFKLKLNIIQI